MTKISRDDVIKLAALSSLQLRDEEIDSLPSELEAESETQDSTRLGQITKASARVSGPAIAVALPRKHAGCPAGAADTSRATARGRAHGTCGAR